MHRRGNQRVGLAANIIFALIAVAAITTVIVGVIAVSREPEPVRGSQALPGQVAEEMWQAPKAAPSTR